jgi:hypothetical protein
VTVTSRLVALGVVVREVMVNSALVAPVNKIAVRYVVN